MLSVFDLFWLLFEGFTNIFSKKKFWKFILKIKRQLPFFV